MIEVINVKTDFLITYFLKNNKTMFCYCFEIVLN